MPEAGRANGDGNGRGNGHRSTSYRFEVSLPKLAAAIGATAG